MRKQRVFAAVATAILLSTALPAVAQDVDRPGAMDERRPGTLPDLRRPGTMPNEQRPGEMPKQRKPGTIGRDDDQAAGAAERRGFERETRGPLDEDLRANDGDVGLRGEDPRARAEERRERTRDLRELREQERQM